MAEKMTKKQFVDQMRNCITQLEKGSYFFENLPVGHIFGNKNYGEIKIPLANGVDVSVSLYSASKEEEENPILETEPLTFSKRVENMAEIVMIYAEMRVEYKDKYWCGGDGSEWKQKFVDWSNEFEEIHKGTDWKEEDYLEEIVKFARMKIKEFAHLDAA